MTTSNNQDILPSIPFSQIILDDWLVVSVSGADKQTYLQGQLTADINTLTEYHACFAAHCDSKGKVWSNMLLFKRGDDIFYIVRKSVADIQIAELKKYAVFSKVSIEVATDLMLIGLVGQSTDFDNLSHVAILNPQNNCITQSNLTYIKLPSDTERYIVIGSADDMTHLNIDLATQICPEQWLLFDMKDGFAIIDKPNSNEFLPQAFGLQLINSISFKKGCYCGQEMVARAQYRGLNKRALYLLSGESDISPIIGDSLMQKMGENWRETGRILAVVNDDLNGKIYIQAILSNDLSDSEIFCVKNAVSGQLVIDKCFIEA